MSEFSQPKGGPHHNVKEAGTNVRDEIDRFI